MVRSVGGSTSSVDASGTTPPPTPGKNRLPSSGSSSTEGKGKKPNTLNDLIETERSYVELLAGIIRKVAGAWSRSNLPPPELDTMFRGIESIYKANRSMLSKLKDVGANSGSSSARDLGDLVMRWVDHIETAYASYCSKFCTGFDTWELVQSNSRLPTVLAMFSATNPPPLPATAPEHPAEPPLWTLDRLFLLPRDRLEYYRKLYTKLMKSTVPGREDHRLLSNALDKIDTLLTTLDQRGGLEVGAPRAAPQAVAPVATAEPEDEIVIDMRSRNNAFPPPDGAGGVPPNVNARSDVSSGADRQMRNPAEHASISPPSMPISDLERRLVTERTLDIFTMRPRQVRLQISPLNLPSPRELRFSGDVVIRFTPQSTGVEVITQLGHLFILTDLLLICERMVPQERSRRGPDGPDMWLSYPPLAGKHLRIAPSKNSSTALVLTILRKEVLTLQVGSPALRNQLLTAFSDCIGVANNGAAPSSSKSSLPPVPTLPTTGGGAPPPSNPNNQGRYSDLKVMSPERHAESMSPPSRVISPDSVSPHRPDTMHSNPSSRSSAASDAPLADSMTKLAIASEMQARSPPPQQGHSAYPSRSSSRSTRPAAEPGQLMRQPSFGPGQIVPPQATHPGQPMTPPTFGPGQVMPPQGYGPGQVMPPQGYGPGQVMPPHPPHPQQAPPEPAFGPGQVMPPRQPGSQRAVPNLSVDPGMVAPRRLDSGLRSAPPDSGFTDPAEGPYRPGMGPAPLAGPGMGRHGPSGPHMAHGYPASNPPSRAPSNVSSGEGSGPRRSTSSRSLRPQHEMMSTASAPPMPGYPGDLAPPRRNFIPRTASSSSLRSLPNQLPPSRPLLPSEQMSMQSMSTATSFQEPSPPVSPVEERPPIGPTTTAVTAQLKCKVFLQQQHAQWKSLGAAKLKLYVESPTNVKQLVVEADNKDKSILISTIVLVDGVERVGKTGVAVELSAKGRRSGVIYMLQLRNEKSAQGLFDSLIQGSDRSAYGRG
ncbi:hypothetical protein POSPLADRAFT_1030496 [Postia placenta MAD-698-R-SB12]|uniref:DH domain-containing protein n=1 Tax=Postia placenta MAD-698-R-SB12 TaxID=670580 RepID=A0A1X6NFR3_9APHY|nr:hypothetical protein POSPLADRAFT_1030496 [Postia placenta MAD-698-R-SB12]OSX67454.1 hypothetical protein POSPLADRAFT_1030496 [Postia placenta MAD-698-R-SB12]